MPKTYVYELYSPLVLKYKIYKKGSLSRYLRHNSSKFCFKSINFAFTMSFVNNIWSVWNNALLYNMCRQNKASQFQ